MHNKHYESRKAKMTYILEWREYKIFATIFLDNRNLAIIYCIHETTPPTQGEALVKKNKELFAKTLKVHIRHH